MHEYDLLAVSPGDLPELSAYLVAYGDMVYFVLGDPMLRSGQPCIVGYPKDRQHMAARYRSNWKHPASHHIPTLVIQRIQDYSTQN